MMRFAGLPVLVLLTFLVFGGQFPSRARAETNGSESKLQGLVPSDATMVMVLDSRAMVGSESLRDIWEVFKWFLPEVSRSVPAFLAQCHLDFSRDPFSFIVSIDPRGFVLAVVGDLDKEAVLRAFDSQGLAVSKQSYKGHVLYSLSAGDEQGEQGGASSSMAFLPHGLLLGPTESVQVSMGSTEIPRQAMLVPPSSGSLLTLAWGKPELELAGEHVPSKVPPTFPSVLRNLKSLRLRFGLREEMALEFAATFESSADARAFQALLEEMRRTVVSGQWIHTESGAIIPELYLSSPLSPVNPDVQEMARNAAVASYDARVAARIVVPGDLTRAMVRQIQREMTAQNVRETNTGTEIRLPSAPLSWTLHQSQGSLSYYATEFASGGGSLQVSKKLMSAELKRRSTSELVQGIRASLLQAGFSVVSLRIAATSKAREAIAIEYREGGISHYLIAFSKDEMEKTGLVEYLYYVDGWSGSPENFSVIKETVEFVAMGIIGNVSSEVAAIHVRQQMRDYVNDYRLMSNTLTMMHNSSMAIIANMPGAEGWVVVDPN